MGAVGPNTAKTIRLLPDYAEAYNNLGNCAAGEGETWDEAIAEYRKALAIRSDYSEAHNNLGVRARQPGGVPGKKPQSNIARAVGS